MLIASLALASEIQVTAPRPVVVAIDGRPAGVAGTLIDTRDLEPGTHRIQVRNFVGSLLAEGRFELGDRERLRIAYHREERTLTELDRSPLECEDPEDDICTPVNPSSLVITGLNDISGLARVHGDLLRFNSDVQGFLATGIDLPAVEVHLEDNEQLRFHGAVELNGGRNTTCQLLYKTTAWLLDCDEDGDAHAVPVTDLAPVDPQLTAMPAAVRP